MIYDYDKLFFKFRLSKYQREALHYESIRKNVKLIKNYREKRMWKESQGIHIYVNR